MKSPPSGSPKKCSRYDVGLWEETTNGTNGMKPRTPVVTNTRYRYAIGFIGEGLWGPIDRETLIRPYFAHQRFRIVARATKADYRRCCLAHGESPEPAALAPLRRYYFIETD